MIKPTVGSVVWFRLSYFTTKSQFISYEPFAAIITSVITDRLVNLVVFSSKGEPRGYESIPLLQDGDAPPDHHYCEWMPDQKGQAAKTEELEKRAGA